MEAIQADGEFTNPEKVLWPGDGYTKGDFIAYLRRTAAVFLPHFRNRPVTMRMYPRGIGELSFFRRELPDGVPPSIHRADYETATNHHTIELPIIDTIDDALWLASAGAIEFHLWSSQAPLLDEPIVAIFDLDSGDQTAFARILEAAVILEQELARLGLTSCPKTSGGNGLHVYVPLAPGHSFDDVRGWVERLAGGLRRPTLTSSWTRKAARIAAISSPSITPRTALAATPPRPTRFAAVRALRFPLR